MSRLEEFAAFLQRRLDLPAREIPSLSEWSQLGNTVGALGLRFNLLTVEQIDLIVEQQDRDGGLFGETAVALGFVDPDQVDRLLSVQELNRLSELAGHMVVRGQLDTLSQARLLVEFLSQQPAACA